MAETASVAPKPADHARPQLGPQSSDRPALNAPPQGQACVGALGCTADPDKSVTRRCRGRTPEANSTWWSILAPSSSKGVTRRRQPHTTTQPASTTLALRMHHWRSLELKLDFFGPPLRTTHPPCFLRRSTHPLSTNRPSGGTPHSVLLRYDCRLRLTCSSPRRRLPPRPHFRGLGPRNQGFRLWACPFGPTSPP